MTITVPNASARGMLRRGSFTSPAVNVMLFQASAEKSEPTCATHSAISMPNVVVASSPGASATAPRGVHRSPKLLVTACEFQPTSKPTAISAMSAPVFVVVKTF
jgi:hypothetical protein